MPKQKKVVNKPAFPLFLKRYKFALALIVFFTISALCFFNFYYSDKVFPNVYFGDQNLMGMSRQQASTVVNNSVADFLNSPIKILVEGNTIEIKPQDTGVNYDVPKTVDEIMNIGRKGNLSMKIEQRFFSAFTKTEISPVYQVNSSTFSSSLDFSNINVPVQNATIIFENGIPVITQAASGKEVDLSAFVMDLKSDLYSLSNKPITLKIVDTTPTIKAEQAQKALAKVKDLNDKSISLSFGYDKWVLGGNKLISVLNFEPKGYESGNLISFNLGEDFAIGSLKINGQEPPDLEVLVNQQKLDDFVGEIAKNVNRPTVNATLKLDNGKVSEFLPAQDGQVLDVKKTKNLILAKVSANDVEETQDIDIPLPVNVTKAQIDNPQINSLGINDLIGKGVSYFAGSIPNRVFNIGLGASLVNGTLVAPGEIFSFDKIVGPVSSEQGFKQAYVISSGRTVLDDGGGICQVSTTVFRAALNTGLPILERTAHAYRVGYYEQHGFGPGLDATIWSPSVDLKFKNDTEHYILVQAVLDKVNAKLEVDIYGTSDGRKVEVSQPSVSDQVPPPPPLYQDDPTLPKGTVKQVDFAAWGARTVFTRKVYKNGQLTINESFNSNFRPWQAVYLVGTS